MKPALKSATDSGGLESLPLSGLRLSATERIAYMKRYYAKNAERMKENARRRYRRIKGNLATVKSGVSTTTEGV